MNRLHLILLWMLLAVLAYAPRVQAQTDEPTPTPSPAEGAEEPPIPQLHIVQEGENLTIIAQQYGVTVAELQGINNLADEAILYVGQQLIIPGGQGDEIASVYTVQVGDTLKGIADGFNNNVDSILRTNRLINPHYLPVAGQSLTVISRTGSALPQSLSGQPHIVVSDESLLMISARYNLSPAVLAAANGLSYPAYLFPGQRLRIPGDSVYRDLPGSWSVVQVRPWPVIQGSTLSIYVENLFDGIPTGTFAGQPLHFTPYQNGFVVLSGLDAFTEPGLVTLELGGSGNRPWQSFLQELTVGSGNYGVQYITIPPELDHLLAPEVRQREDAFLETIYTRFTETQLWDGVFQFPVTNTVVTAPYGDSRSYNDGPIEIFHTGVDFAGSVGTTILAPANGVVVFDQDLELRGRSVIIDHGLGVMTAYFHLSEVYVEVGASVLAGEAIAAGGSTGLSSGPHLHWEVRIMNVPVDGMQWTRERFP